MLSVHTSHQPNAGSFLLHTTEHETSSQWMLEAAKFEPVLPPHEFKLHVLNREKVEASIQKFQRSLLPNLEEKQVQEAMQKNGVAILKEAGFNPDFYTQLTQEPRSAYLLASSGQGNKPSYCMKITVRPEVEHPEKVESEATTIYSVKTRKGMLLQVHFHEHDGLSDDSGVGGYGEGYFAVPETTTLFSELSPLSADPLIGITAAFNRDPNPDKVDLGVGAYRDHEGDRPEMSSISKVKAQMEASRRLEGKHTATAYLPIEGLAEFNSAVKKMVFGDAPVFLERIATVQGLGGTNPIATGAFFLKKLLPAGTKVYVSEPSWPAHRMVFEHAGFQVDTYPYYDRASHDIPFDRMLEKMHGLPEHSVVVLQACCHNPTGADLTDAQWQQVIACIKDRKLVPFIDMAYQGFGQGVDEDGKVVRDFAKAMSPVLVSTSYSKNFAQYGERVGALSVVTGSPAEAQLVEGQLKSIIRPIYSNPPAYGAKLVAAVLNSKELYAQWVSRDIGPSRVRIQAMRHLFVEKLKDRVPEHNFEFIKGQQGMFSLLNLTVPQIRSMREKDSVYLIESGRICMANLNTNNMGKVVQSIGRVLQDATLLDPLPRLLLEEGSPHVTPQEKQAYLSRTDYQQVRTQGYEKNLLTLKGQVVHALNTIYVERAVQNLRVKHASLSEAEFHEVLETTFPSLLQDGLKTHQLDVSYYKPASDTKRGYARYLLYSNPDKKQPFCFQMFVFGEGQKTRLHNHMAPCATVVLQGSIEESQYQIAEGTRKGDRLAQLTSKTTRHPGSIAGFDAQHLLDVHHLRNVSVQGTHHNQAITVHYYRDMDGAGTELAEATHNHRHASTLHLKGLINAAELFRKIKPQESGSYA